ncbi:MAG: hypothetical protein AMXMBFR51_00930, partial [Ignavibacteriota bacterium]
QEIFNGTQVTQIRQDFLRF